MSEFERKPSNPYHDRIENMFRYPEVNDSFFNNVGMVTTTAIFQRDLNSLDMIFNRLQFDNFRNHNLQDIDRFRMLGNTYMIQAAKASIYKEDPAVVIPKSEDIYPSFNADFEKAMQALSSKIIETKEPEGSLDIASMLTKAMLRYDKDKLEIGYTQLGRIAKVRPARPRGHAVGMRDVIKHGLMRISIFDEK